jgi:hypothetical protein
MHGRLWKPEVVGNAMSPTLGSLERGEIVVLKYPRDESRWCIRRDLIVGKVTGR